MNVNCRNCGTPFRLLAHKARYNQHFCKLSCFKEARRRGLIVVSQPLRRVPVDGLLRCLACKTDLPETEFRRIRGGRSWSPWCIPCARAAQRRYAAEAARRKADPERPMRVYKARHREEADTEADRARLKAWIEATDVQPRIDGWGPCSMAAMSEL